jgi:hypothetical protein
MTPRIHSVGHITLDYSKTALGRIRERFLRLILSEKIPQPRQFKDAVALKHLSH